MNHAHAHDHHGSHGHSHGLVDPSIKRSREGLVAFGLDVADPLIGLAITRVILRITWQSWRTVRHG